MSNSRPAPSTARMARHSLWNLLGMTLPMLVGLVAIPPLIRGLGEERFGAMTLVWMIVGYFGILDLGMGRALTKLTAERLGRGREDEVHGLFWTAVLAMIGIGVLVSIPLYCSAEALAYRWLQVSPDFQGEVMRAFEIVSWGLPVVVLTVGLIGVLEAYEQFFMVNLLRLPFGTFTFLGPLLTLPFSKDLAVMVSVLIVGRCLEVLTYGALCIKVAPVLRHPPRFQKAILITLLSFGGWMTVSNLLLPLMIHVDRFFVGSLLTVAVVAFYTTPAELVVKLLILPRSIVSVLFPQFASRHVSDPVGTSRLCVQSLRYLWLVMFPAAVFVVTISPEFLFYWLGDAGPSFREHAAPLMQLLALGMYVYSPGYVPYSYIQAIGKPAKAAVVHLIELPIYLGLTVFLIQQFGLKGAAYAWITRACMDVIGMLAVAWKDLPDRHGIWSRWAFPQALGVAALIVVIQFDGLVDRLVVAGCCAILYLPVGWLLVLAPEDRLGIRTRLKGGG